MQVCYYGLSPFSARGRASEWSALREKRSWGAGGERKNPDKDVVSLANSYDWSKVHLWTFQSHEPINLPLYLTWLKVSSSHIYNQMNSDQLPSTGTWGVRWGVGRDLSLLVHIMLWADDKDTTRRNAENHIFSPCSLSCVIPVISV